MNELICLADDPNQPGFNVSCYHKDLEPFMQRGRELKKQGLNDQQIFETREKDRIFIYYGSNSLSLAIYTSRRIKIP